MKKNFSYNIRKFWITENTFAHSLVHPFFQLGGEEFVVFGFLIRVPWFWVEGEPLIALLLPFFCQSDWDGIYQPPSDEYP